MASPAKSPEQGTKAGQAVRALSVEATHELAKLGHEAHTRSQEFVLLPCSAGDSTWGDSSARLADRNAADMPLKWSGDAPPESDVASEIVETVMLGKTCTFELKAVQGGVDGSGAAAPIAWEEECKQCSIGDVISVVGTLGVGRNISRLTKVTADPVIGGKGPKETIAGFELRRSRSIGEALANFTSACVGMEGAISICLVPATEENVINFIYGVSNLNRALAKGSGANGAVRVDARIDNMMSKYGVLARGKIALGLSGGGAVLVRELLSTLGHPVGCFSRDTLSLVGIQVTMSRPEGNGVSAAEAQYTMRKAASYMTTFQVFVGGVEMESFIGGSAACDAIFGEAAGEEGGEIKIVDDTLERVNAIGGTALKMTLAVPVNWSRKFQAGLNAWVGACANGVKSKTAGQPNSPPMGLKVKEGILGATHEFVVATGASGLRKAMDNAGMETRDARVGGESAQEIKKLMQEQTATHRKEMEKMSGNLAEAIRTSEESVGGRVDDMATELSEVTSSVGSVRGKVDRLGPRLAQHLDSQLQPAFSLLQHMAPLVGVQDAVLAELALPQLEYPTCFSPADAGGMMTPTPGARKSPAPAAAAAPLRPRGLDVVMGGAEPIGGGSAVDPGAVELALGKGNGTQQKEKNKKK